jgi:uncharacterized protein (TIGR04255 family)
MSQTRLPKRITPDPIIEAVVEIRFDTAFPSEAIFGLLYNELKEKYTNTERLPILQLPEEVRRLDNNLRFQPYYRLRYKNFVIQIGSNMLSLSVLKPYSGWSSFSSETNFLFEAADKIKFIKQVTRCGLKYIDVIEDNVFEKIRIDISSGSFDVLTNQTFFRTQIKRGQFDCFLQLNNDARGLYGNQIKKVSSIEVDTFLNLSESPSEFFSRSSQLLNDAHQAQKEIFFISLLKTEYLNTLNPEYDTF